MSIKTKIDLKPVSVEQARAVLGSRANNMTDQEINSLLTLLRSLCDKAINLAIEKHHQ